MKPSLRSHTHFTGRPNFLRGPGDHHFFGVVELLDAEAAADVGRYDAQLVLRDVQHEVAHQQLHDVRKLAGGPHRVVAARHVVLADHRTRLHRIADQPVVDQADLGDVRRLLECGVGRALVAQLPVDADVVGNVVEQTRERRA